jgi:hypothetical protein
VLALGSDPLGSSFKGCFQELDPDKEHELVSKPRTAQVVQFEVQENSLKEPGISR